MKQLVCILLLFLAFEASAQNNWDAKFRSVERDSVLAPADSVLAAPPRLQDAFRDILKNAEKAADESYEDPNLGLGLLIVNETRTRFGAQFYDMFYQQISLLGDLESATVLVREEPFRARLTRLLIKVNDVDVVETVLRPNMGEMMEELSNYAVERVTYYINNYKEVQQALNGEDLSGSGIY